MISEIATHTRFGGHLQFNETRANVFTKYTIQDVQCLSFKSQEVS